MLPHHHAYVFVGHLTSFKEFIQPELKALTGHLDFNNSDAWLGEFHSLSIEDSRAIKSASRTKKIVIAKFSSATVSAQNALLKTLEEPAQNVKIFLIVPNVKILLPTVLSRVVVLNDIEEIKLDNNVDLSEVATFLQSSVADRLLQIEKWKKDDSEINKIRTIKIVEGVEFYLWQRKTFDNLKVILNIKKYLYDQSFNFRLTLIYLALALPPKLS